MQEMDYKWFLNNYNSLFEEFGPQYLSIKDKKVLGAYPTYADAVRATVKTEELGSFIVQYCNGKENAYTNYISSLNLIFD